MYSFSRTDGWYEGRPVVSGSTPPNPSSARSSSPTKTSIARTGLSSQIQSSRYSGKSVLWLRSSPSTKRLISCSRESVRENRTSRRFHTARVACAQAYPTRPVRIIVGYSAGSASDIVARLIAQWLSERIGQQFVVENRTGAGGNIAAEAVVRSAPDGYTLLLPASPDAINATLYQKLNFNFIRDIAPVAGISHVPNVMVVHPSFPAKT